MSGHDHPVFTFPDERSRNETGRALRRAGFRCFATGPAATESACVLTLDEEAVNGRESSAIAFIHEACPEATRRS
jgi:hypothetical protein